MVLGVNTNVASLKAQNNLGRSQNAMNTSLQRLSTGLRINSAKDDAAGLAISNRMTSQINGLNQATRNANDAISLSQTAEGAMQESTNILQRMRELSVQSANDTYSSSDRNKLQAEVGQLQQELNRIAETTNFNGTKLLDGSFSGSFQIGDKAGHELSVALGSAKGSSIGSHKIEAAAGGITAGTVATAASGASNGFSGGDITIKGAAGSGTVTVASGSSTAKSVAADINKISGDTGVNAEAITHAKLTSATGSVSLEVKGDNDDAITVAAEITDASDLTELARAFNDVAGSTGISAKIDDGGALILKNASGEDISITNKNTTAVGVTGIAADGETPAGAAATIDADGETTVVGGAVTLNSAKAYAVTDAGNTLTAGSSSLSSVGEIDISKRTGATDALTTIDNAMEYIDSQRADLGAVQNRMESTISNLQNQSENISASRSRIQDTDFAKTAGDMTKQQILQQAGVSALSQANASSQLVLSLIG
jgi:flagellin